MISLKNNPVRNFFFGAADRSATATSVGQRFGRASASAAFAARMALERVLTEVGFADVGRVRAHVADLFATNARPSVPATRAKRARARNADAKRQDLVDLEPRLGGSNSPCVNAAARLAARM
jgi:hypothetical protein